MYVIFAKIKIIAIVIICIKTVIKKNRDIFAISDVGTSLNWLQIRNIANNYNIHIIKYCIVWDVFLFTGHGRLG